MDAGDVAAVVAAVAAAVLVVGLLVALAALARGLRELRHAVEELREQTLPVVHDLQVAVREAHHDLDRFDGLLGTAESLGQTVEAASRLAYLTFSNPVVKALSAGAGVARAGRRLRRARG